MLDAIRPLVHHNREGNFLHGQVAQLSTRLRRVTAPNPGFLTFAGTNTYIVGTGTVAIIDPGPRIADHLRALLAAVAGERVSHILVSHTHVEHSGLAAALAAETGAIVGGFGSYRTPESADQIDDSSDRDLVPELLLYDGTILEGPDWTIEVLHTPGHCSNHICFVLREEEALLTGDHVMGWSTTVVAPPDGDMAAYINALERLRMRAAQGIDKVFWPGHGGPVCEPEPYLTSLIAHRHAREAQILDVLAAGPSLIGPIVSRIYANVDLGLHSAAASSTYAHLICLAANGLIVAEGGETRFDALYRLR